jgi:hypothetical protein
MSTTKSEQVRVYLNPQDLDLLAKLAEATGMRDTAALSMICKAGLRAVSETDFRMSLPLRFIVHTGHDYPPSRISTLNDAPPPKKR